MTHSFTLGPSKSRLCVTKAGCRLAIFLTHLSYPLGVFTILQGLFFDPFLGGGGDGGSGDEDLQIGTWLLINARVKGPGIQQSDHQFCGSLASILHTLAKIL